MSFNLDDRDDGAQEVHEINVTPFIDVILVLLIIFMVAAPLSTVDVPVDLPTANAAPSQRDEKPLFLTVKVDGGLTIGDTGTTLQSMAADLAAATRGNRDARLFLRADKTVQYGALMEVMNVLRAAGYLKVALVALEGPVAP